MDFINNLGTFTLIVVGKVLLIALWVVLKPLSKYSKWINKKRNKLANKIFWNSWIVAIFESFVIVILCTVISIKYNF